MENEEIKIAETKTETKSCGHAQNRPFFAMSHSKVIGD